MQKLPVAAQKIFLAAFNNANTEYKGDEKKSYATAWAAVEKNGYQKRADGKWVKRS